MVAAAPLPPFVVSAPQDPVVTPAFNVALVLAGCGHRDGAEITEATTLMVALSERGFRTRIFAPDAPSAWVIDHLSGHHTEGASRNIRTEAARIARGQVEPLSLLTADGFDALVFAGGFGVAVNLCSFATAGEKANLQTDVSRAMGSFVQSGKVVGALCIAPVLLGLFARDHALKGVRLTLGDGSAQHPVKALQSWGVEHVPCSVRQACVDPKNRFVTAPAYMFGQASPSDIMASSKALVDGVRRLLVSFGG
jgi:enhancing lycopene biosynthesis protein 2